MEKAVALLRVSTKRQEKSRWGLEAQEETVDQYKKLTGTMILKTYVEVVSGKEKKINRPVLRKIIRYCKKHGAFILIAKLDRLARNVGVILYLMDRGVKFVVADMPLANRWQILRQAVEDEEVGVKISEWTSKGLQAAKRKGVELGKYGKVLAQINKQKSDDNARKLMPTVDQLWANGFNSEVKLLRQLNFLGILTARGRLWGRATIHALLKRIEKLKANDPMKTETNNISSHQMTGI